ncbi:NUDIX domain-containing protein [Waterburya agarophytonicola K14]|uniref:NUDIX domain-containing protein n=1 Tax=Waterburya agarophytonicola KI4 TaxID=2874699 RepID=A0A964BQJ3_9CYAN|nr:NUDIX domain-containing protein [Waterburya agarophytonicola]MCC0177459.1 NUDIX domain-containing protein [Waterburya agarophytonicola KI4]
MKKTFISSEPIAVAMAIIYQEGKYLMQLRDDIPGILYPGVWGLFGGHLDPGEEPEAGLKRELIEEINYSVDQLTKFRCYADSKIIRHMYSCPLLVPIERLQLNEGWDLGLLTVADIQRGYGYSTKAQQERSLGDIHRQMMLDFIATQTR